MDQKKLVAKLAKKEEAEEKKMEKKVEKVGCSCQFGLSSSLQARKKLEDQDIKNGKQEEDT